MSIYSGFAQRKLETRYNNLLNNLVLLLSDKLSFYLSTSNQYEPIFKNKFGKIVTNMMKMEESKYLLPKFSKAATKLYDLLDIQNVLLSDSICASQIGNYYDNGVYNSIQYEDKPYEKSYQKSKTPSPDQKLKQRYYFTLCFILYLVIFIRYYLPLTHNQKYHQFSPAKERGVKEDRYNLSKSKNSKSAIYHGLKQPQLDQYQQYTPNKSYLNLQKQKNSNKKNPIFHYPNSNQDLDDQCDYNVYKSHSRQKNKNYQNENDINLSNRDYDEQDKDCFKEQQYHPHLKSNNKKNFYKIQYVTDNDLNQMDKSKIKLILENDSTNSVYMHHKQENNKNDDNEYEYSEYNTPQKEFKFDNSLLDRDLSTGYGIGSLKQRKSIRNKSQFEDDSDIQTHSKSLQYPKRVSYSDPIDSQKKLSKAITEKMLDVNQILDQTGNQQQFKLNYSQINLPNRVNYRDQLKLPIIHPQSSTSKNSNPNKSNQRRSQLKSDFMILDNYHDTNDYDDTYQNQSIDSRGKRSLSTNAGNNDISSTIFQEDRAKLSDYNRKSFLNKPFKKDMQIQFLNCINLNIIINIIKEF